VRTRSPSDRRAIAAAFADRAAPCYNRPEERRSRQFRRRACEIRTVTQILSLQSAERLREYYDAGIWHNETIYQLVRAHGRRRPDAFAARDGCRRLTFDALLAATDALASELLARGVRRGDRVFVWLPERIEAIVAILACMREGFVVCPSPHRNHTTAEIVALLTRTRAVALLYEAGHGADAGCHDIAAALPGLDHMRAALRLEPLAGDGGAAPFAGLVARGFPTPDDGAVARDPDAVSYLAFTSGTTGAPKGVMHSDNTLLTTMRAIVADWRLGPDTVVYSLSPLSHNLGIGALLTALVAGGEFVLHDLPRGASLVDRIVATGATYLVGVPTHAIDLLAELRGRELDRLGRVAAFRISGAAAPGHVKRDLCAFGLVPQSGYGMTESNSHHYTLPDDPVERIVASSGRACRGFEARIFDVDDPDREVSPGETGIVGGRGGSVMLGYFDDQPATEAAFNAGGWLMSGDLGRLDEDGYLHLVGRAREIIVRGGHNIDPLHIEALALRHDAISGAAAIPVPDARLGERICLAVAWRNGASADVSALLAHLGGAGLSRYEMPEFLLDLPEIPLMPNGKIRRREIADAVRAGTLTPVPVAAPRASPEQEPPCAR
jgi:acyl-CoA synthetase